MNRISKPVLVTGGCGFIGSHLVPQLIERGYDIVSIDKDIDGSRSFFGPLDSSDRCVVYECDIRKT